MFGQSKISEAIVKICATLSASLLLITVLTFLAEKNGVFGNSYHMSIFYSLTQFRESYYFRKSQCALRCNRQIGQIRYEHNCTLFIFLGPSFSAYYTSEYLSKWF